jgi:hypothetical protein
LDEDEWRCWQCGQYYYPSSPVLERLLEYPLLDAPDDFDQQSEPSVRLRRKPRTIRDINRQIVAKVRSDARWWTNNADIIRHLDEGRTVREISSSVGRSERQVRLVRERLNDLRASMETVRAAG